MRSAIPIEVEIRMYNVGFGDCFGIGFHYETSEPSRHILIDFGSTRMPKRKTSTGPEVNRYEMTDIASEIKEWCGGKLTAIVATHRHKDHISGFGGDSGDTIAALEPDLVVQPWTEDPALPVDATTPVVDVSTSGNRGFVASLAAQQRFLEFTLAELERLEGERRLTGELAYLGENNITNRAAVEGLMRMGQASEAEYVSHGMESGLSALLPGVTVHVLGPPTVDEWGAIKRQRHEDDAQFWHLMAHALRDPDRMAKGEPLFHRVKSTSDLPVQARWLKAKIDRIHASSLFPIVRALDDAINNTSLILLFEIGHGENTKLLLFPGDAQIENWEYCLTGPDAQKWLDLLSRVDIYKVGHHGSLNATPKIGLWANFQKRSATEQERLITLLSTRGDVHGSRSRNTEVPRTKLIDSLKLETTLFSTQHQQVRAREIRIPVPQ